MNPAKANHLLKYTGHLLRCCAQINPQRIKDTPAVNLCSRLVPAPSIFKRLTEKAFQNRQGRRWFHAVASFSLEKLVVEKRTRMCASQQAISAFCRQRRSLR